MIELIGNQFTVSTLSSIHSQIIPETEIPSMMNDHFGIQIDGPRKFIAAGVIEIDGKILIAQRAKEGPDFGKWEFPGGKVETGETLQECLKRELFEELGIDAIVGEYLCTSTFSKKDILFDMCAFKVPFYEGEMTLNEHSAIAWVTPSELSNYDMPEPDLPIVKLLQGL